jgi:hypothetical protein
MRTEQNIIEAIEFHEQMLKEAFIGVCVSNRDSTSEFMALSLGIHNLKKELAELIEFKQSFNKAA